MMSPAEEARYMRVSMLNAARRYLEEYRVEHMGFQRRVARILLSKAAAHRREEQAARAPQQKAA